LRAGLAAAAASTHATAAAAEASTESAASATAEASTESTASATEASTESATSSSAAEAAESAAAAEAAAGSAESGRDRPRHGGHRWALRRLDAAHRARVAALHTGVSHVWPRAGRHSRECLPVRPSA
jgi:hypothetical protein